MICYLDASALVKRYVSEHGSDLVARVIEVAEAVGTVVISRAEIEAGLAKAVRMGVLADDEGEASRRSFSRDWPHLMRLQVTEHLVERAATLAWQHGLRGYDAVHLAAASVWQDALGQPVTLATFDRRLWNTCGQEGLQPFPPDLPKLLERWNR